MSDAILSRNQPTGKSMTRKNAVLGVLLALFVVIAFYYREQAGVVPGLFGFTPIVALG
ncbi:hypothetical protein [Serratia liquefaciens]|uniref:hypothetical protein n=1 Tax=Serratia liquefaciens TaxID=614 RepID=UPI0021842561|nr:hypothetical protein [Serratia liquefaciens]CAI2540125.1 Uncharacterised protein [Serratia liquefaciens]